MLDELDAHVGHDRRRGLGEPVAVEELDRLAEALPRLQRQVGRHRGAAHREAADVEVEVLEARVLDDLAGDGGHAAERGEALVDRELQRAFEIPLAHDQDLGPAHRAADDRRDAADVEHGLGRERGRLAVGRGARPVMDRLARRAERHVPEVVQVTAVGAERALRAAGRARRVEDGDRVVGFEACDRRRRGAACRAPGRRTAASAARSVRTPTSCVPPAPSVVDDPLEPFVVEERDRWRPRSRTRRRARRRSTRS